MTHQPIDQLFREALLVVNRSLAVNRGKGIYGTALAAADPMLEGHQTRVLIYEDDPSAPFAAYGLQYRKADSRSCHEGTATWTPSGKPRMTT